MIVKHRRQCEVYSGTSSGKSSEAMYCFRCRDPIQLPNHPSTAAVHHSVLLQQIGSIIVVTIYIVLHPPFQLWHVSHYTHSFSRWLTQSISANIHSSSSLHAVPKIQLHKYHIFSSILWYSSVLTSYWGSHKLNIHNCTSHPEWNRCPSFQSLNPHRLDDSTKVNHWSCN